MRITFDITRFIPKYLMADRNGKALARGIERAFQYVAEATENGLDIIQDVEKMPEWRLDEVARDYGIPYDYTANIDQKRTWIRYATKMYRVLGTREAVAQYLEGFFGAVEVQENWEYGGTPYHFRVFLYGVYTPEMDAWARKSIEMAKNTRSVLDDIGVRNRLTSLLSMGTITAEHSELAMTNEIRREVETYIGARFAVAAISQINGIDEGTTGRDTEATLETGFHGGTVLAAHSTTILEVR